MVESIQNQIKKIIPTAEELYNKLVLVVGESGSGKTAVLLDAAKELGGKVINLNLALSFELLELTEKQRVLRLPGLISTIIEEVEPIVFLDNIEILFDKGLKQDPLKLLKGLSRNHLIVASWNGKYKKNKLIYANPDHPEYRVYDSEDTIIVSMDRTTTINFEKI
ncbi:MAG: BREX-3 system P-loop-containing protein BrxF [Desulfobacula sp.]|jgi:hypothetical protein|nr:BREX-3 system P-loop-containing protein BrxF [Desulfobacula sp.]